MVRAEADDPPLLEALTAVFGGAEPPPDAVPLAFSLRREGGELVLHHPAGRRALRRPEDCAAIVQGVTLEALAAHSPNHVRLHAAALAAPDGRAVLLPAVSGTGKSTAALALAREGWRCLSDDLVYWELATGLVHGGDFAICLKAPPPAPLADLPAGFAPRSLRYLDADEGDASLWACAPGPSALPWRARVAAVFFLERGGATAVRAVTAGESMEPLWALRLRARADDPTPVPADLAKALAGVRLARITTSRVEDVVPAILRALAE